MAVSPVALVVTGLLAGAVSSLVTVVLMSPGAGTEPVSSVASAQQVDALRRQLEGLTEEQKAMERRLQTLQLEVITARGAESSADVAPQPMVATHEELSRLKEQVASLSQQLDGGTENPVMLETVSAALTLIRDREDREREAQRDADREQRAQERLDQLAEALGLDTYQRAQFAEVVDGMALKRDAILEAARASGEFGSMRDAFTGMRDELQSSLALFLTPSQLTTLEEQGGLRSFMGGGRGGFGGGGFGGGPPRGGFGGGGPGGAN